MSKAISYRGFDITRRIDGSYAVWDMGWWPDEELDSNPELNAQWLEATGGWRAKGWQVVHVAPTFRAAHNWAYNVTRIS
jgi:hypothetical protein